MNTLDLSPIVQPIIAVAGAVIAALLAIYVPKGLAAFQARTGIMLNDQQRSVIQGFVSTAAGTIETKLDQKVMQVSQVHVANPAVLAEAQSILAAAPVAAGALGMTVEGVGKMIVGAVNTAGHGVAEPAPAPVLIVNSGTVS